MIRRSAAWLLFGLVVLVAAPAAAEEPASRSKGASTVSIPNPPKRAGHPKLDTVLNARHWQTGESDVIVEFTNEKDGLAFLRSLGTPGRRLGILKAHTARIPNQLLERLAANGLVKKVSLDRKVKTLNGRTAVTTGARTVQELSGYNGAGIGVAVIDSGVTNWHQDLTNEYSYTYSYPVLTTNLLGATEETWVEYTSTSYEGQRVAHFADFVNGATGAYDDFGHGTHVAGIIAGNGAASASDRKAIAPGASIIALKALDNRGNGTISNIIAAIDYAISIKDVYNIRVLNMSFGAGVYESYETDPLTLAAKRAVDAGIVVVAAAGNLGKAANGAPQYGAITAPANAPWVLTVGASSTEGTIDRIDDVMAGYSSKGPTMYDYSAKPDLVAPGTGTVSLSDPYSYLYLNKPQLLLPGIGDFGYLPYLSLSGTSMSAPAVSGTVALMLQANPSLTPNLVKAILQFTAQVYPGYNWLTQGAGFLNTRGAVQLAEYFQAATPGLPYPDMTGWSSHVFWGNHRVTNGVITPGGTAWAANVRWGARTTSAGQAIVWGENCVDSCANVVWGNNPVWGTSSSWTGDNVVWGNTDGDNVVWGNCVDANGDGACDNVVWGNGDGDNIVWGNSGSDNVVWGNDCQGADCDNVVWGNCTDANSDGVCDDNVVWGNCTDVNGDGVCDDNVVWGNCVDANGDGTCDNVVWGNCVDTNGDGACDDNIVWGNCADENGDGACADNIVWGNCTDEDGGGDCDNIVWGNSVTAIVFGDESTEVRAFDVSVWDDMFRSTVNTLSGGSVSGAVGQ